jgi:hypothetical protein
MKTILLIAMLNGTCAQLSHNEESERREGEDWSIAGEYVHSLLQQTKSEDAA